VRRRRPGAGAVDGGGVIDLVGDHFEAGRGGEHNEREAEPGGGDQQDKEDGGGVLLPGGKPLGQEMAGRLGEAGAQEEPAIARVKDLHPDQGADKLGDGPGQDKDGAPPATKAEATTNTPGCQGTDWNTQTSGRQRG
jgi:hypothetical protein